MYRRWYAQIGKWLQYVVLPFVWFGKEKRVRIVVLSRDGYILLVRNWFGYQNWSLPGGGSKKAEPSKNAAVRELHEETGIVIDESQLNYLRTYTCNESFRPFEVEVYYVFIEQQLEIGCHKNLEIIEKRWHKVKSLPQDTALPIGDILEEITKSLYKKQPIIRGIV